MSTLNVTNIKAADGTTGLTIANSTGHVTMPNTGKGLFQVYSNSSQSLASNATTIVQLDQKVFDPDTYFNTTNYRYIPQIAGYYVIEGQIMWEADAADNCYFSAYIYKFSYVGCFSVSMIYKKICMMARNKGISKFCIQT